MCLNFAIEAARDAVACYDAGQLVAAQALIVEAAALVNQDRSEQASHLIDVLDSYERTEKHDYLGEFCA